MVPAFVFIFGGMGLAYFIKKMIEKKFIKKVMLPKYIKQESVEVDTKTNTYSPKTTFEVPGCGIFDSEKKALIGAKKCALDLRNKQ